MVVQKKKAYIQISENPNLNERALLLPRVYSVGSVLVKTKGEGVETYTAPEEDWIVVKPGDRLGIYEKGSPPPGPGGVSHDECNDG